MSKLRDRIELAERAGTIKRLHVDKQIIQMNTKNGTNYPPITIQTSKGSLKANRVKGSGDFEFIYDTDNSLSCGAKLWIEVTCPLEGDWSLRKEKKYPELKFF